jgi:protein SCO1/2
MMTARRPAWPLWLLLVSTIVVIASYGWVRFRVSQSRVLPMIGQVTGFTLTNQMGQSIDATTLKGQVWVADLIFTRCPGPCLKLTRNLVALQQQFAPHQSVRFVSLTADPEFDTPEILRAYAQRFGADGSRWHFLTGTRTNINQVAIGQLLLAVQEKEPDQREAPQDLYLHSTKWVLIDASGRLRAIYEGTDPNSVRAAARDIRRLLRERNS